MNYDWNNENDCLEAVKINGTFLQYVKNQTPEICMEAVKSTGWAIQFVENPTTSAL